MNTLIFLAGCGVGALVSGCIFLWVIGGVTKGSTNKVAESNKVTEQLMRDRNELDKKKVQMLTKLADWCDNNWNIRG